MRDAESRLDRMTEAQRTGIWEQQTKACLNYGKLCPFHPACLGMPGNKDFYLQQLNSDYVNLMGQGMSLTQATEEIKRRKAQAQEAKERETR